MAGRFVPFRSMTPLSDPLPLAPGPGLPISAVERETGLAKDTLRVWERRYGFPRPERDSAGDRRYPADQVRQLTLIRRLMDTGLRPSKLMGVDLDGLQALLARADTSPAMDLSRTNSENAADSERFAPMLNAIAAHDPAQLRHCLSLAQSRMGLAGFVTTLVAPLTTAVGEFWAQGRFEVFEEHLYTEVLTGVLRQAIASLVPPSPPPAPKVLLTTLPQEMHGLGLLMVEALLALEGCNCVSLGTQTPIGDVAQAARAHRADIVGLSFSSAHNGAMAQACLGELRSHLPPAIELWAGGACPALYSSPVTGITPVRHLTDLQPLVARWRQTTRTSRTSA